MECHVINRPLSLQNYHLFQISIILVKISLALFNQVKELIAMSSLIKASDHLVQSTSKEEKQARISMRKVNMQNFTHNQVNMRSNQSNNGQRTRKKTVDPSTTSFSREKVSPIMKIFSRYRQKIICEMGVKLILHMIFILPIKIANFLAYLTPPRRFHHSNQYNPSRQSFCRLTLSPRISIFFIDFQATIRLRDIFKSITFILSMVASILFGTLIHLCQTFVLTCSNPSMTYIRQLLHLIVFWDHSLQPWKLQSFFGRNSQLWLRNQCWKKEACEMFCLLLSKFMFYPKNEIQGVMIQNLEFFHFSILFKIFTSLRTSSDIMRVKWTNKLLYLSKMILVFRPTVSFPGLEQEIPSQDLIHHTTKGPNIRSFIIALPQYYFRRTILSSLYLSRKVMMLPASVTQISYFYPKRHLQRLASVKSNLSLLQIKQVLQFRSLLDGVILLVLVCLLLSRFLQLLFQVLLLVSTEVLVFQFLLYLAGFKIRLTCATLRINNPLNHFSSLCEELIIEQLASLYNLPQLFIIQANHNIFWFQISMYNSTYSMKKIESLQNLPRYLQAKIQGQPRIVIPFDNFQQIASQDLKDHAEMIPIITFVNKRIQQPHNMGIISTLSPLSRMTFFLYFLQDLNLIKGSLHIMRRAFLNFHSYICIIFEVFTKPDSREMPPTQLLYNHISIKQHLSDMYWMISSNIIILNSFILRIMLLLHLLQKLNQIILLLLFYISILLSSIFTLLKSSVFIETIYIRERVPQANI